MMDATCPAIHAAPQASKKGLPFLPLRGILGTDVPANRPDWQVIDNPFGSDDPIVALPAILPDVALFHCEMADREDNLWIGAGASSPSSRTPPPRPWPRGKDLRGQSLRRRNARGGRPAAAYVDTVSHVPGGAKPLAMPGHYDTDSIELDIYCEAAAAQESFGAWLADFLAGEIAA